MAPKYACTWRRAVCQESIAKQVVCDKRACIQQCAYSACFLYALFMVLWSASVLTPRVSYSLVSLTPCTSNKECTTTNSKSQTALLLCPIWAPGVALSVLAQPRQLWQLSGNTAHACQHKALLANVCQAVAIYACAVESNKVKHKPSQGSKAPLMHAGFEDTSPLRDSPDLWLQTLDMKCCVEARHF